MAAKISHLLPHLRQLTLAGEGAGLTDGQLLDCFIGQRDEAAFRALVKRHGPMVFGVCRRILRHVQDAEDAFQATFLVLARKAASIKPRAAVGNWLYGVACRTAMKARGALRRRQSREQPVKSMAAEQKQEESVWADLQPFLDQELHSLPNKYRLVVVLRDLEGRTSKQVAQQLNIPEGTVFSRLNRGREMLRQRLSRRGFTVTTGALAVALTQSASAGVPGLLVNATVKAAMLFAAGQGVAGIISIKASALAQGVLKSMLLNKLKMTMVVLLAIGLAGTGGGLARYYTLAREPGEVKHEVKDSKPVVRAKDENKEARVDNDKAKTILEKALEALKEVEVKGDKERKHAIAEDKVALIAEIAALQAKIGEREASAKSFEQALDLSSKNDGAGLRSIARCKASLGDVQGALELAKKEAALPNGQDSSQDVTLGWISAELAGRGDYREARAIASKIQMKRTQSSQLLQIVWLQLRKNDLKGALQTVEELTGAAKVDALVGTSSFTDRIDELEVGIALWQAAQGKLDDAKKTVQEALKLAANLNAASEKNRALAEIARRQAAIGEEKAAQETRKKIDNELSDGMGKDRALAAIARTQAVIGEEKAAQETINKITNELQKESARALMAVAYARRGKIEQAQKTAATVASGFFKPYALEVIAYQQAKKGDRRGAKETFQQALQSIENLDAPRKDMALRQKDMALHLLATAQAKAGDFAEALRTVEKQSKESNYKRAGIYLIALQQAKAGDIKGALQTGEKTASLDLRGGLVREIARDQAKAGKLKEALALAEEHKAPYLKSSALVGAVMGMLEFGQEKQEG